jgi:hypothetical protein
MQVRTLGTVTRAEDEVSREGAHRVEKGATGGLTQEKRALNKKLSRGSMSVGDFQKTERSFLPRGIRSATFLLFEKKEHKKKTVKKQRENLKILSN